MPYPKEMSPVIAKYEEAGFTNAQALLLAQLELNITLAAIGIGGFSL